MTRAVFFLSDGTGITAETLGNTLLTQFPALEFERHTIPFIGDEQLALSAVARINSAADSGELPILFSTTVAENIREILKSARGHLVDLFEQNLDPLEQVLGSPRASKLGLAHGMADLGKYQARMAAVEYAIEHDDGQSLRALGMAEVILVAPSRCGKTPTSMYLALQHGIKTANFPLVDEDFNSQQLPASLVPHLQSAFGLISSTQQLHKVRTERRPNSKYASIEQCTFEIQSARKLFETSNIPFLDSSNKSIEEISAIILAAKGLRD